MWVGHVVRGHRAGRRGRGQSPGGLLPDVVDCLVRRCWRAHCCCRQAGEADRWRQGLPGRRVHRCRPCAGEVDGWRQGLPGGRAPSGLCQCTCRRRLASRHGWQYYLVHAGCQAGHNVLAAGLPVVCGAGSGASLACVVVVNVATVGVAVVPIFEGVVGGGRHRGALLTAG